MPPPRRFYREAVIDLDFSSFPSQIPVPTGAAAGPTCSIFRRILLRNRRLRYINLAACMEVPRMLKSIGVVVGSYVLSIILVLATDPLLSRLFPGDFVRGRIPSNSALAASTALFVVVSIFCA